MSFRRFPFQVGDTSPFERFNTRSQEDRNMFYDTSPIRRSYWNDLDTDTRHFEEPTLRNPPIFRNSDSAPGSPKTGQRASSSWSTGSIPIKVVHEKSKKDNSESSNGQNCSQGSSPSTGSEPPREPRIHHIPIMVEPRGDSNTSHVVGNGSDEQFKAAHPNTRKENMQNFKASKHHQGNFSTKTHLNNDENIKTTGESSENGHQPRVCHIPIMVEPRIEQTFHSPEKTTPKKTSPFQGFPPRSNSASQPFEGPAFSTRKTESAPHLSEQKTPKKSAAKPASGPHVSKVPVNVCEPTPVKTNQINSAEYALNQISKVKNEMVELKKQIEEFSGSFQDKQYRYLDEMLTQCMLKLDNIDTGGLDEIRKARKIAINEVQTYISLLESKITRDRVKVVESSTQEETVNICKESKDSDKSTNNIPSEVEMNTESTQQTVPCLEMAEEEKMECAGITEKEQSELTTEDKIELSEVNTENPKSELNKLNTETKTETMEIETIENPHTEVMEIVEIPHKEQVMEVENSNNSISNHCSESKELMIQTDKESVSDKSKDDSQ